MAGLSAVADADAAGNAPARGRQLPVFHCPYCGDEELTPYGESAEGWRCGACLRAFTVRLIDVTPAQTVAEQDAEHGPRLYERDPDRCCDLRKVRPLAEALSGYAAWASGVRREESAERKDTKLVDWDEKREMLKINPLAAWTQDDVDAYIEAHQVPVNPLAELGYASIGCAPCTRPVAPGEDPRAGRWAGRGKTECGIHL